MSGGDRVQISLSDMSFLKASLVIYLVPTLALVVGALTGSQYAEPRGIDPNTGALVGGVIALAVALIGTQIWGRRRAKDKCYTPTITRVLSRQTEAAGLKS